MAIPKLFAVRFDYTGNGELVEGAAAVIADSPEHARKRFRKLVAGYLDVIPESGRNVVDATGRQIDDNGIADLAIREVNRCLDPFFGFLLYGNEIDTLCAKVGDGKGEWSEQEADEHARELEAAERLITVEETKAAGITLLKEAQMVTAGSKAQAMLGEAKASWTNERGREPDDKEFELMVGMLFAQLARLCATEMNMPMETFKKMLKDLGFLPEFVESRVNASDGPDSNPSDEEER
jgi:hypothetical protein